MYLLDIRPYGIHDVLDQFLRYVHSQYSAWIHLFKVNNGNNRKMCEICSKLTTNMPEWRQRCPSDFSVINFEHIADRSGVSIVDFEKVNVGWVKKALIKGNIPVYKLLLKAALSTHCQANIYLFKVNNRNTRKRC